MFESIKRAILRPGVMRKWRDREREVAAAMLDYATTALSLKGTETEIQLEMYRQPECWKLDKALKKRYKFYQEYGGRFPEILIARSNG